MRCKDDVQTRTHYAIASILNHRFTGSEVFGVEAWIDNTIETASVTIDSVMTLGQIQSKFESLKFSTNVNRLSDCVVALWVGEGKLSDLSDNRLAHVEIVFQVDQHNENNNQLIKVHFRTDKHDQRTAKNWLNVYQSLAARFSNQEQLEQLIGQLDLTNRQIRETVINFGTRHTLTSAFSNQPSEEFTFHRQFEKQVAATPDRIAVWAKEAAGDHDGIQWDYQTLNQQSNAIANFLIEAGIQVEDTVGIVMDRRVCLLAALLGVMKAGGRYVGLEPELPADRLTFMMDDASVKFIITEDVSCRTCEPNLQFSSASLRKPS